MHKKYGEMLRAAIEKGNGEEAWEALDDLMETVEHKMPELFSKSIECLEELAYTITQPEAEQIVRAMRPRGQNWSYNQVKDYLRAKGIEKKCVEYYLVMNMAYNDYYDTAKMFGLQNEEEFYFSIAKDFIDDPDAPPFKVARYFLG